MKLNPKQLALSAAVLGLLAVGMAVPATAASPFAVPTAIVWPWESVSVETVETGDYAASMTVGTAQQLSPVVSPSKAAQRNPVSYVSDNPNIVATVASENSDLEVVAYVTVSDRPLLDVGDPCKLAITGLSEYSYGNLTGTVTAIDSDITSSSNGSYYKMTIKP